MNDSLKEACQSSIIASLGEIATSRFTCGGSLSSYKKMVQLNYLDKTGVLKGVCWPLTVPDIQQIIEAATVASFGKGNETVTDKTYRDAYALEPAKFTSSFLLSETTILGEIHRLLAPDAPNIYAELYKMNIYAAPVGCFKSHVDTPRALNMFGSLVVCLHSHFNGGALVTKHNGQQVTYNWSSTGGDELIKWAAFYSDVSHEILPVTEGNRVTLTYNLFHDDCNVPSAVDECFSSFCTTLKAALDHPHFLRDGRVLGFACQHAYTFEKKHVRDFGKKEESKHVSMMKGSDRTVLMAAECLHLKVKIRPICNVSENAIGDNSCFLGEKFGFYTYYLDEFDHNNTEVIWMEVKQDRERCVEDRNSDTDHIIWCQKFKHLQPAYATVSYGNEHAAEICYQAAAILITIPKWSERQEMKKSQSLK